MQRIMADILKQLRPPESRTFMVNQLDATMNDVFQLSRQKKPGDAPANVSLPTAKRRPDNEQKNMSLIPLPATGYIKKIVVGLLLISLFESPIVHAQPAGVNGIVTTIAGNGQATYTGDGGPADVAGLNSPFQVHVDGNGNYIITDWANQVIRKVESSTGTITSTGIPINRILAMDDEGYVYASIGPGEWVPRIVVKIDPNTGNARRIAGGSDPKESASPKAWKIALGWPLTVDRLGRLYGVGCIDGNVNCYQLLRVDYENDVVDIIAGSGARGFSGDGEDARLATVEDISAIAVDGTGNTTFSQGYLIRRVSAETGIINTVGDASLFAQSGAQPCLCSAQMAVDGNGDVYFSLTNYPPVYGGWTVSGTSILKSAADGSGLSSVFYSEYGYSGDGGPLASAQLSNAMYWDGMGLAFDHAGNLYIADTDNNVIRRVDGFGYARPAHDTTPPEVNPQIVGTVGKQNWYRSDISLTWNVSDPESLIATIGCNSQTVTEDTSGLIFTCTARSMGGTTQKTVTLKRDTVVPSALALPRTAVTVTGWSGPTRVHYLGIDLLSGIDSCSADVIVSTEGENQSSPDGKCTDLAGNTSLPVKVDGLNIDLTPPSINWQSSPPPNAAGWNNTPVTVFFTASDTLSGVAVDGCDAPVTLIADAAGQFVLGRCVDLAGNIASSKAGGFNIDRSPPNAYATLTPSANANGWNAGPVTGSFSGTDAFSGSGIRNCSSALIFSTEGPGQVFSGGCEDVAGNSSTPNSGRVNIDKTLPQARIIAPLSGTSYEQGSTLLADYNCTDSISGIMSCSSSLLNGAAISTSNIGTFSLTVLATDLAGNSSTSTSTFSIVPRSVFTVSPTALAFGDQALNTSTAQVVTLRNNTGSVLALTAPTLSGKNSKEFALARTCGTSLAANTSCTITVTFKPTAAGAKTAAFSLRIGTTTQAVALSGAGVAATYTLSPTALTFPNTTRNITSVSQRVTVANTSNVAMPLTTIALGGTNANQFVKTQTCGTILAASSSCFVDVAFKPTSAGSKSATLTVTPGGGAAAKSATLKGTGL